MKKIKLYVFSLGLAFTSLFAGCSSSGLNIQGLVGAGSQALQAATISDSEIQSYVRQYVQDMDKKNKVAPADSPYTKRLALLTQGLTSVDGIPLNFKVYITPEINAFACADGSVRVYSGLMDKMNDDEVLGVIGHEIGHVAHKDTRKSFQQALLQSAVLSGIGSTSNTAAVLTSSQLAQIGSKMMSAKYSQKQESNADDYGYDFLKANGKNPWAMAYAFSKLEELEGGQSASSGMSQMFSSHPSTPKRIKHIMDRCKKDGISQPVK